MSYLILPTDIEHHLTEHLFSISCLIIVKFEACGFGSARCCLRRLFMVFVSWDMLYRLLFCFILFSCDFIYLFILETIHANSLNQIYVFLATVFSFAHLLGSVLICKDLNL